MGGFRPAGKTEIGITELQLTVWDGVKGKAGKAGWGPGTMNPTEGGTGGGWIWSVGTTGDTGGTFPCLLYTSDAADDWLVV